MKTLHKPNEIIGDRYRLVSLLGEGTFGSTYEAEDLTNYHRVAIKALSPKPLTDSKVLESFEREANILASLDRPAIPKFLDSCYIDSATHRQFYLVRELIDGESLADLIKKGWHPNEEEIKDIAIQILECLDYLHGLESPVIHSDIKPQNIIRRRDGKVFLVDLRAVQEVYRHNFADDGMLVGTVGYMPPEQYSSQVKPATDIYALGATLLFLLTHRAPDELPQHRLKIEFRDRVNLSPELADVLEKMLEPFIEERFQSATEVLAVLTGGSQVNDDLPIKPQPDRKNPIRLNKTKKHLIAEIPSVGWTSGLPNQMQVGSLIVGLIFGFCALIPAFVPSRDPDVEALNIAVFLGGFSIISLAFLGNFLFTMIANSYLEINEQTFKIQWKLWGFSYRQIQGKTRDIRQVELNPIGVAAASIQQRQPIKAFTVVERMGSHQFGMMLDAEQKQWLVEEILDFLTQLQPRISETDSPLSKLTQPRGSRVVLQKNRDRLLVTIPPTVFRWYRFLVFPPIIYLTVALITTISDGHLIEIINNSPFSMMMMMMPFLPFMLYFIFVYLLIVVMLLRGVWVALVRRLALRTQIEIDRKTFKIDWNCLGFRRQIRGQVAHLQDVLVGNGCVLVEGILDRRFGSHLTIKEQRWLVAELAEFLGFTKSLKIKEQHQPTQSQIPKTLQQPIGSQIKLKKTSQNLVIHIPAHTRSLSNSQEFGWLQFILMFGGAIGVILMGSIDLQTTTWQVLFLRQIIGTIPLAIAITIWLKITLLNNAASTYLEINQGTFWIQWKALFFKHEIKGRTADIKDVKLDSQEVSGHNITIPTLVVGSRNREFGQRLAEEEKQWLIEELSDFLGFNKSRR